MGPSSPDTADESVNKGNFLHLSHPHKLTLPLYQVKVFSCFRGRAFLSSPSPPGAGSAFTKVLTDFQRSAGGCPRTLSCVHAQEGTARSQEEKGLEGTVPRAHIGPLESLLPSARIENLIIHRVLVRALGFLPFSIGREVVRGGAANLDVL